MFRKFVTAAAFVAFSAGGAVAATPLTATLAAPARTQNAVLASIVWRCEAVTCVSASALTASEGAACRAVAKAFGRVTAFSSARGPFDEGKLATCNGSQAAAQ